MSQVVKSRLSCSPHTSHSSFFHRPLPLSPAAASFLTSGRMSSDASADASAAACGVASAPAAAAVGARADEEGQQIQDVEEPPQEGGALLDVS